MANSITSQLAEYWQGARYDDLPSEVLAHAKRLVLDALAVGLVGSRSEAGGVIARSFASQGNRSSGESTLWGSDVRLSPSEAALANGTFVHACELDDFGGCGHSGAVVIPSALAVGEWRAITGREFLLAIVAGYDVAARITFAFGGYRDHSERGWYPTGTAGALGATAAAAKVLRLSTPEFTNAFGIAGAYLGGTWAFLSDGSMTKRLIAGRAAENGVSSAIFAHSGMTGPSDILEAEWGGLLGTLHVGAGDPGAAVRDLGTVYRIMDSGIKHYACCRQAHGLIQALSNLMEADKAVRLEHVTGLTISCDSHTRRKLGRTEINSVVGAQMSLPYCIAITLETGGASLEYFDPVRSSHPRVRRALALVRFSDAKPVVGGGMNLEIRLRDGTTIDVGEEVVRGGPSLPSTDQEVQQKAVALLEPFRGRESAQDIIERVQKLEELQDIRELSEVLRRDRNYGTS